MQQVLAELDKASNRLAQLDKELTEVLAAETYSEMGSTLTRVARTQVRCAHTDVAIAIHRLNDALALLKREKEEMCKP